MATYNELTGTLSGSSSLSAILTGGMSASALQEVEELKSDLNDIYDSSMQIKSVTGDPAVFETNCILPLKSCKVEILPTQAGSGNPAPNNIRAISTRDSATVTINGTAVNIDLATPTGGMYAGTLDLITGVLAVYGEYVALPGIIGTATYGDVRRWYTGDVATSRGYKSVLACDSLMASNSYVYAATDYISMSTDGRIVVTPSWAQSATTTTEFNTLLASHPVNVVVELDAVEYYQLTPRTINTLVGTNTISADCGDVSPTYLVSKVAEATKGIYYTYNVAKTPSAVGTYYTYTTTGTFSSDSYYCGVLGGIALRGAQAIDFEIASGYQFNFYFTDYSNSTYTLVKMYSTSYQSASVYGVEVPAGSTRLTMNVKKSDGTTISAAEALTAFNVRLIDAREAEFYDYTQDSDLFADYYGNYQYNGTVVQAPLYDRLTQERFWTLSSDNMAIQIAPKSGYKLSITFFDANMACLGNLGTWVTQKISINAYVRYSTAKYFKITIAPVVSSTLSTSDYNALTTLPYRIKTLVPIFNNANLKFSSTFGTASQDIAVYDDMVVIGSTNELFLNGTSVSTTCGHGNNIMFGTTLYNDYPKLYSGGWYTYNKCIFVNAITENSATLIDTIELTSLPDGYVNMCVDEANQRFYIFEETGETTYVGNILFAVADFSGNILSSTTLDISIPIIQGMDFKDGYCYVTSGNGSTSYPNYLRVFDTTGKLVAESLIEISEEIEGICIAPDGTVYIKCLQSIFTY